LIINPLLTPRRVNSGDRLREQHRADGMSTLEAVAAAVSILEGACVAEPLERLCDEVVRRTIALCWGIKPSCSQGGI